MGAGHIDACGRIFLWSETSIQGHNQSSECTFWPALFVFDVREMPARISKDMPEHLQKICQNICQKECRKTCQKRMLKELSENMSENMSEKNVRSQKICQEECQKKCQKICQKFCQKRTPERLSEEMSEDIGTDYCLQLQEYHHGQAKMMSHNVIL